MSSILHNPYQVGFLEARRKRVCVSCNTVFDPADPNAPVYRPVCPACQSTNVLRAFNRLTLISGRRGGKTMIGAVSALDEIMVPGSIGWACAPTYPKLHDYVMPALKKFIPEEWFYNGTADESIEHKEIRFANGSLVQFRSLDDEDAGRGPGLDWVWIDEVCEIAEGTWDVLRPALTERRGVAWFTTSPRGYDWVHRRFWTPATTSIPGYWACRYKTSDNPIIDPRELEQARGEMSAQMYRQEYEADFVTFEGAIYQVPSQQILRSDDVVKQYIPEWPRIDPSHESIVGIDPGADHPFAAVWLIRTEKGLVAVWEYLERMRSARQHAKEFKNATLGHQPRFVIDKTQKQTQIELAQHEVFAQQVAGGPGSVNSGIDRVKAWLEQGKLFLVESRVPRLIEQMHSYRWKDTRTGDGAKGKEEPFKMNDDLVDALRYAVMSWPSLPTTPEDEKPLGRDLKKDPVPEAFRWEFERMKRIHEGEDTLERVQEHPVGALGWVGQPDDSDDFFGAGGLY